MLEGSGASLVIVGLLLLVAARLIGNALIDALVKTDANRPAAHHAWLIATQLLHDSAIGLVVYGLLIVIAGILAGPSRPATWLRRELAPAFRRGPWIVHGVGLVLFLLADRVRPDERLTPSDRHARPRRALLHRPRDLAPDDAPGVSRGGRAGAARSAAASGQRRARAVVAAAALPPGLAVAPGVRVVRRVETTAASAGAAGWP